MKFIFLSVVLLLVFLSIGCTSGLSPVENDRAQSHGNEYNELSGPDEYSFSGLIRIDSTHRNEFNQIVVEFDYPVSCSMSVSRLFYFCDVDEYDGVSVEYTDYSVVITDRFGVILDGYLLKVE